MANDTVIFEVRAEGKNLKVVRKEVDAVADGVERTDSARKKAGKGQDNYNKREKAIYQTGLSSAKGFSKMNQTIGGGSSGLVGAYATLAANVFAATAAFNALSSAARFEQLEKGLNAVGAAAGRNLGYASQKLVEVSGHAISTEQAMRSMALGISSGFSTEQMEGLTKVAKGASLALGRDMADAMDRLVRGAAKLEPEILDELGIMVRLDDATEKYATTMGKTSDQLSQFERRQAFLNEILEQGNQKFGSLAESVDPNPYDKLSASLQNLAKQGLSIVNTFLTPLVQILAQSQGALVGTLVLFVSTIARQLVPGLANMARGMADNAQESARLAQEQTKNLDVSTKMPKVYRETVKGLDDGNMSAKEYSKSMNSLNGSIRGYTNSVQINSNTQTENNEKLNEAKTSLKDAKRAKSNLIKTMLAQNIAQAKESQANAVSIAQQQGLRAGLKANAQAYREMAAAQALAAKSGSRVAAMFGGIKAAAFGAAGAIKIFASSMLSFLGTAGLIISVGYLLYDVFKDMFITADPYEKELDKIQESMENVKEVAKAFNRTLADEGFLSASVAVAGYTAISGSLLDLQSAALAAEQAVLGLDRKEKERQTRIAEDQKKALDNFKPSGNVMSLGAAVSAGMTNTSLQQRELDEFGKTRGDYERVAKKANDKIESIDKASHGRRLDAFNNLTASYLDGVKSNPAFSDFASVQIAGIEKIRARIGKEGEDGINNIKDLLDALSDVRKPASQIEDSFKSATSAAQEFQGALSKLSKKEKTPFDDSITAAEVLSEKFNAFQKARKTLEGDPALDNKGREALKKMQDELEKQLGITDLPIQDIDKYIARFKEVRVVLLRNREVLKGLTAEQKRINSLAKKSPTVSTLKAELHMQEKIRVQKMQMVQDDIDAFYIGKGIGDSAALQLAKDTGNKELYNKILEDQANVEEEIAGYREKMLNLANEAVGTEERTLRIAVRSAEEQRKMVAANQQLAAAKAQILDSTMKQARSEMQLNNASRSRSPGGMELTPSQELSHFNTFASARAAQLRTENEIAKARINIEKTLEQDKLKRIKQEWGLVMARAKAAGDDELFKYAEAAQKEVAALPEKMVEVYNAQIDAADSSLKASLKGLEVEHEKLRLANIRNILEKGSVKGDTKRVMGFAKSMGSMFESTGAAAQDKWMKRRRKEIQDTRKSWGFAPDSMKVDAQLKSEMKQMDFSDMITGQQKVELAAGMLGGIGQQFAQLGEMADNPIATALGSSMENWGSTLTAITDPAFMEHLSYFGNVMKGAFEEGTVMSTLGTLFGPDGDIVAGLSGIAAGIAIVATSLETVYAVQSAGLTDRIRAIDAEIEATKKLSMSQDKKDKKILEMEKKKEAMKKKQFQVGKKMMMAQAAMATALGIIMAISAAASAAAHTSGLLFPVFAGIFTGVVAALGVAQMAIISGMSYQGGGSGGGGAGASVSKIGVGSSSNKVDVAGSRAGGELGYMRGERGMGSGASNFTRTAFVGAKYRATGGAAYVVGEQGPELFVPEVPGQIVANEDMEAAGAPINATFNIQTIDATNMEETLISQRGNIIGMIREAANNQGQQFLEGLDTMALGDSY